MGSALMGAQPAMAPLQAKLKSATQDILQFAMALQAVHPEAAADFREAVQSIAKGVTKLMGGGRPAAAPPGQTAPPVIPSGGAPPETPEAAG